MPYTDADYYQNKQTESLTRCHFRSRAGGRAFEANGLNVKLDFFKNIKTLQIGSLVDKSFSLVSKSQSKVERLAQETDQKKC